MSNPAVDQLIYLLDQAFDGDHWHSFLGNLHDVTPEEWCWLPPGGDRSIRDLVLHVGACKFMYENHAFGDAALTWEDPFVTGAGNVSGPVASLSWLRAGHDRLRLSLAAIADPDLDQPRLTNWGEPKPTRWIVMTVINHDVYHAGEINHLRSLRHSTR